MKLDYSEYKKILIIVFICYFLCVIGLIIIQLNFIENWVKAEFGQLGFLVLNQFLFGSLGGIIAGGLFAAKDIDINELEITNSKPDAKVFRLPNEIDKWFYLWRFCTSGIFAVLGTFLIIAGFSYLEVDFEKGITLKQFMFFTVASIMIGLKQFKFLNRIENLLENILKKTKEDKKDKKDKKEN